MEHFQSHFQEYLAKVREAKSRGASHDYQRQVFIEFARESFGVNPTEVELEKGLTGAKFRGNIDALYQDLVFEFKRDLRTEREKGKEELERYLRSLGNKQVYFGVLTDGIVFEAYLLQDDSLRKVDDVNLERLSTDDAFLWFDAFLFSEKELVPTSQDVVKRFGDTSPVFNSSLQRLTRMLQATRGSPSFSVKFGEWDKLLAKAYGHSVARNELFLRHTYLSLLAKLLAYTALFGEKPKGPELREIVTGKAFTNLPNLAEEDFFCWVLASPLQKEASELLRGMAQHLAVYDLTKVDEDLLKELYENLVDRETKHDLGEVYTPDWLVELTLKEAGFGRGKSLLDPACGSGTFLFTAIQLLRDSGLKGEALVDEALSNVVGIDVHPLAVTIAKVNYVLALSADMPAYHKTAVIPVYMADSLLAVDPTGGERVVIWAGEKDFFNIPQAMTAQPGSLDRVIDEMRRYIDGDEDNALDGFMAYLRSQGYEEKEWGHLWRPNLKLMRKLVEKGRDTIWAFILKNYYRPAYLRQRPFDIVAGNPPWLSYRYITDPGYQQQVKRLVLNYGLLGKKDVKLFTQMEEATLFFTFSADHYLKKGGVMAFVMPRSVLTGAKQHKHFQELLQGYQLPPMALERVLDAEDVSPLFKVPACVLIARKHGKSEKVDTVVVKGSLLAKNLGWSEVQRKLKLTRKQIPPEKLFPPTTVPSPYLKEIKAGANIYPRCLWFVHTVSSPYGINRERPALETSLEVLRPGVAKKPWHDIHLRGEVEAQYLYATMLSRQLLPFGYTGLSLVVLPLEDTPKGLRLINKEIALAKGRSGLHNWLLDAEKVWQEKKKTATKADLYQWLDYMRKLTSQQLTGYQTVLYSRMGTNLASTVIGPKAIPEIMGLTVNGFVTEWTSYYYQTKEAKEAHYICAFLNSEHLDKAIKPYQTRGAWGERDISRTPFEAAAIPKYNPEDAKHQQLAELSKKCHQKVAQLKLEGKSIGVLRNKVRQALAAELDEIDRLVKEILSAV